MKVRKLLPLLFASQLVMFSAAAAGASYQTIYSFAGGTDGEVPVGGVIFGKNGSLYGVTNSGGNDLCGSFLEFSGCGTVFELTPQSDGSWEEDVLHVFNEFLDGGDPAAAVVMDGRGNLYGSTQYYGPFSNGTLWRLTPSGSGWSERILHVFTGGSDGFWCYGLTLSQAHLFGTTYAGGPSDNGEVFELSERPNGKWADKALHYFSGGDRDGDSPSDAIILDAHGNIFGTTYEGGPHIAGTVFEMQYKDGKWKEAPIYFFQGLPFGENFDGTNPTSGVVFDQQGNLYGTTDYGGSKGVGTIYELSPTGTGGWTEKVLYTFMDGKTAAIPPS